MEETVLRELIRHGRLLQAWRGPQDTKTWLLWEKEIGSEAKRKHSSVIRWSAQLPEAGYQQKEVFNYITTHEANELSTSCCGKLRF